MCLQIFWDTKTPNQKLSDSKFRVRAIQRLTHRGMTSEYDGVVWYDITRYDMVCGVSAVKNKPQRGWPKGLSEQVLSEQNLGLGCKAHDSLRYKWSTRGIRNTHFLKHKNNWYVPEPERLRCSKMQLRVCGTPQSLECILYVTGSHSMSLWCSDLSL